ncbi:hypothetical protein LCGC14_2899400 [marine sediment metagenome]|uniref:PHA accumulation regulator DNA-binding N-terminal domain-containing protein n=1 Tax=marine sediment metagenome TaxID=412755 RepID=A0A0F8YGS6_9ZZZZ
MAETTQPLLIKRYASRRLYNTETSDYVTLEDIARFIREGREVQIVDLKSGDDLTRQYLLQRQHSYFNWSKEIKDGREENRRNHL